MNKLVTNRSVTGALTNPPFRSAARWALVAVLTAGAVGCGDDEDTTSTPATTQTKASAIYVGETMLTAQTSVAVVVGTVDGTTDQEAAVYICDGVASATWFNGTAKAGVLDVTSADGAKVTGTVEGGRVTGRLQVTGAAAVDFSAPVASGIAGLYLVNQSATAGKGYSANGGQIDATIDASRAVAGTIKGRDGASTPLAGTVKSFGEESGAATWIVQANGDVKGRATKLTSTGTAGGGNCSAWSSIKSLAFGVNCSFF